MHLFLIILGAVAAWYLWHKIDDVAFAYVDNKVQTVLHKL